MQGHETGCVSRRSAAVAAGAVFLVSVVGAVVVVLGPAAQATTSSIDPVGISAGSPAMAPSGRLAPDLAQVTVRPDAPKRVFEEKEDRPWTLLLGKAMLPATLGLGVFVVIWYVMKLTRTRYRRS